MLGMTLQQSGCSPVIGSLTVFTANRQTATLCDSYCADRLRECSRDARRRCLDQLLPGVRFSGSVYADNVAAEIVWLATSVVLLKPVLRSEIARTRSWTSRKSLLAVHPHTLHRPKLFPAITASSGQIRNIKVCQRRAELT
jgi:hypothetical protein